MKETIINILIGLTIPVGLIIGLCWIAGLLENLIF